MIAADVADPRSLAHSYPPTSVSCCTLRLPETRVAYAADAAAAVADLG